MTDDVCPTCGAKMVYYSHTLSKGIVSGLVKLHLKASGPVNIKELNLSRNQWDNFQKLKYWELVEQIGRKKGVWKITDKGKLFVEGATKIKKKVWTYRGEVQSYEGEEIAITDVLERSYKKRQDYADEAIPVNQTDLELF